MDHKKKDLAAKAAYEKAEPKQFGNLHERMKFVIKALEEARGWKTSEPDQEFDEFYHDLVFGIFDLETEVKYFTPQNLHMGRAPNAGQSDSPVVQIRNDRTGRPRKF